VKGERLLSDGGRLASSRWVAASGANTPAASACSVSAGEWESNAAIVSSTASERWLFSFSKRFRRLSENALRRSPSRRSAGPRSSETIAYPEKKKKSKSRSASALGRSASSGDVEYEEAARRARRMSEGRAS
jgi:hypothetical protein